MVKAYLDSGEVGRLEEAAKCLRDRLLIRVLFWGAMRVSEALGIEVDDLDFQENLVTIKHLKARVRILCPHCQTRMSRTASFCPGCGAEVTQPLREKQQIHQMRRIPLGQTTMDMLADFIRRDGTTGPVFGIGRGRAWEIVTDCAHRAGLGYLMNSDWQRKHKVSPHRLRDAFAVKVAHQDGTMDSMRMLQEHLGHAKIDTTMRYRKVAGQEHRQWYGRMSGSDNNGA